MTAFDPLRPPGAADPGAAAYKDWLHLNVFVPDHGLVALVNTSLHGPPYDARSRAVGVALANEGGLWTGGIEIAGQHEAGIETRGILLETISLASAPRGPALHARIERPEDRLRANLTATPLLKPLALDLTAAFGSGWIGWTAQPLLALSGTLEIGGKPVPLGYAIGYHDHNWGRWFWGEDAAWEWGCFTFPGPLAVVLARASDKAHRRLGAPVVFAVAANRAWGFRPDRVRIALDPGGPAPARRLPGALAAIHPDRRHPDLPRRLTIEAESGAAALALTFEAESAAQLLLAEPTRPGTAFINELAGPCRLTARLGGETFTRHGTGIFEYVE